MLQFTSTNRRLLDKLADAFNINREQITLLSVTKYTTGENSLEFCDSECQVIAKYDFVNCSVSLRNDSFEFHYYNSGNGITVDVPIC